MLPYIRRISFVLSIFSIITSSVQASELATMSTEKASVPQIKQFTGMIEAVNKATMKAQTSGRLAEIYFDVDDIVQKGDVLARFRNKRQKAELDLAKAGLQETEAENERNEADYKRFQDLFERKLVAVSVVDEARAALKSSQARLEAADARIKQARENYEYTIIRAPYNGIVTQRHVELGESVSPGSPLVSGISLNKLRLTVDVPQSLVPSIRKNKKALVYMEDGTVIKSTKITVFPFADQASHNFTIRVYLPSGASDSAMKLYPGMLVKVGFVEAELKQLVVADQAISYRGEMTVVYVKNESGSISMRQIRAGQLAPIIAENESQPSLRIVHAGLNQGEQVFLDPLAATSALKNNIVQSDSSDTSTSESANHE